MPELPEVEALAAFLRDRMVGDVVAGVDVAAISVLKTFDPPVTALAGLAVTDVTRHGKLLDLGVDGLHLVVHLARGGWARWRDGSGAPVKPARPGKGPLAMRVRLASGASLDFTEAGTQKRMAVSLVGDPGDVPSVASLGPDPLSDGFTDDVVSRVLDDAGRAQLKGVLRDQGRIAGIGNAYSDEVLHAARLSPFAPASGLTEAQRAALREAIVAVLADAVRRSAGLPATDLKDSKRAGMRVHGRTGQECPVCGDTVREVSFADSSLQYCATCQTGGKPLADRRMSRLLR
jgi:formamidopyrimidine-DNA glycosylase